MRIEILDKAEGDLVDGFRFYESHEAGLGAYFLDSLYPTSIPSRFTPGSIESPTASTTAYFRGGFRSRSSTPWIATLSASTPSSTADATRHGSGDI